MSSLRPSPGPRQVFAALLAGGKGTRFWPASRAANPKQFLRLFGERSLLRGTFDRFARFVPPANILVVTNPAYAERTLSELPDLPAENLVLEPSGHDTAPAAALASGAARRRHADPILVLAPTDHVIDDEVAFDRALARGIEEAETGALVTFGIVPERPATVYGYIEVERRAEPDEGSLPVLRFREKPDEAEAKAFLATGRFFWNAGIFAWRASAFDRALAAANPALAEALAGLPLLAPPDAGAESLPAPSDHGQNEPIQGWPPHVFPQGFEQAWEALPVISIDYALMEKASGVRVVPLAAGWSDVGSWDAVRERLASDEAGNREASEVLYFGASGCSVHREGTRARARFYALVETDGLIVVETDDAVLICREGTGEALREVVRRLEATGRKDLL